MEWTDFLYATILGLALGWVLTRFGKVNKDVIHVISKDDFYNNMRKGQLIDVRKNDEFEASKIKGARNFSRSSLTAKNPKIRKDQSVYLYCNNGRKSMSIAKAMSKNGFSAIYVLEGGLNSKK